MMAEVTKSNKFLGSNLLVKKLRGFFFFFFFLLFTSDIFAN